MVRNRSVDGWTMLDAIVALAVLVIGVAVAAGGVLAIDRAGARQVDIAAEIITERNSWPDAVAAIGDE